MDRARCATISEEITESRLQQMRITQQQRVAAESPEEREACLQPTAESGCHNRERPPSAVDNQPSAESGCGKPRGERGPPSESEDQPTAESGCGNPTRERGPPSAIENWLLREAKREGDRQNHMYLTHTHTPALPLFP